jgi:hypothetical protein
MTIAAEQAHKGFLAHVTALRADADVATRLPDHADSVVSVLPDSSRKCQVCLSKDLLSFLPLVQTLKA